MTERTTCRFTLKEYDEKNRWILVEEYEPGISALRRKSLGLELLPEVSFTEGKELAALLNQKLKGVVLHEDP